MDKKLFTALIDKNSLEVLNKEFSKARCNIMYVGENRNGSSISKEVVEKAIPTLYNIPIVGEYKTAIEDFGTHGGKIEISDQGIQYIDTTRPFGLVPESCNPRFEIIKEEDGTEHEYLVADVILWSGRYPELQTTLDSFSNESMEIVPLSGDSREDGIYQIDEFQFSALCLLGKQTEPCFESSKVEAYAIETFKKELNEMMKQYTEFTCVDKDKEESAKKDEDVGDISKDGEDKENDRPMDEKDIPEDDNDMPKKKMISEEEYQSIQDELSQIKEQMILLQTENKSLKSQITELQEYKQANEFEQDKADIEATIESFEAELSECEEFTELKKNINSAFEKKEILYTSENLEKELYSMIGRKKFAIQKPKKIISRVAIIDNKKPNEKNEFGENEKYFTNNGGR